MKPIRVLVFHQVSDIYDPARMWECDWTQTDAFKEKIISLLDKGYSFISLTDAYKHLNNDSIRLHKYAVITADDGYLSLANILPWLKEQNIPTTLFINPKYLDNLSWSPINEEQAKRACALTNMNDVVKGLYLSKSQLFSLDYQLIEIGMHGYEHLDVSSYSRATFTEDVIKCMNVLSTHPRFVSFYAYTWGRHSDINDSILREMGIIPVYCDGYKNFMNKNAIHREPIDGLVQIY